MNELRPTQRAYIAGFFDGEGCVSFRRGGQGAPKLIITQKDHDVLAKIHDTLGCGHLRAQPHSGKEGEIYWRLELGAREDVIPFCLAILKYSVLKRPKLKLALKYYL